jgi:hypothetical protein
MPGSAASDEFRPTPGTVGARSAMPTETAADCNQSVISPLGSDGAKPGCSSQSHHSTPCAHRCKLIAARCPLADMVGRKRENPTDSDQLWPSYQDWLRFETLQTSENLFCAFCHNPSKPSTFPRRSAPTRRLAHQCLRGRSLVRLREVGYGLSLEGGLRGRSPEKPFAHSVGSYKKGADLGLLRFERATLVGLPVRRHSDTLTYPMTLRMGYFGWSLVGTFVAPTLYAASRAALICHTARSWKSRRSLLRVSSVSRPGTSVCLGSA